MAQVDPICQSGQAQEAAARVPLNKATKRFLRNPENTKALKRFNRAFVSYQRQFVAIERSVNAQIATIPPATEDVSLIQVWLRVRNEALDLQSRTSLKPPKGLKGLGKVLNSLVQLLVREQEAADLVRDFGFQYCNAPSAEVQLILSAPLK